MGWLKESSRSCPSIQTSLTLSRSIGLFNNGNNGTPDPMLEEEPFLLFLLTIIFLIVRIKCLFTSYLMTIFFLFLSNRLVARIHLLQSDK